MFPNSLALASSSFQFIRRGSQLLERWTPATLDHPWLLPPTASMPYAYRSPRAGAWNAQAQPGYEVFVDETENEVLVDDRSSSSALRAGKKHHGLSFKGSWRQLKSGYKSFSRWAASRLTAATGPC